jgi:hypothetical protein
MYHTENFICNDDDVDDDGDDDDDDDDDGDTSLYFTILNNYSKYNII